MRIWLYDEEECTSYLQVGEDYFELQLGVGPPMIVFIDTPEDRLALQRLVGGLTKLLERPPVVPKDYPIAGTVTRAESAMKELAEVRKLAPPNEGAKFHAQAEIVYLLAKAKESKKYSGGTGKDEAFWDGQVCALETLLDRLAPKTPPNEPYRGPDWL